MTRITRHTVAVPPQSQPLAVLESTPDFVGTLRDTLAGRYGIEREIGRGGMALVYLARELKHNRSVAMKVLRPEFSATLMAQRFFDEIRHTSRLQHPGILPIYESDKAGDLFFYTMPYIPGNTLRKRLLRERQLSIPEVVRLTREIADALSYAHAQGIIHRDIKPENILLSHGHPILADFGIARAVNEAGGERLTSSGLVIGTPEYMSPEQCSKGGAADGRADVYSLGCVVYEMLAGEPPFTGPSAQVVISRQMQEAPRSLRVIRDTIPEPVEAAIMVALAKVPADRFSGAVEFAQALAGDTRRMPVLWQVGRWKKELIGLGVTAAVAAGIWAGPLGGLGGRGDTVPLDTTSLAVLPFVHEAGVAPGLNEVQILSDAISRWTGVKLVDPLQVREVFPRVDSTTTGAEMAQAVRSLGAGRYMRGTLSPAGDSVSVQGLIYDAASGRVIGSHSVRLSARLSRRDSLFGELADHLLLRDLHPKEGPAYAGTKSLPARQAFARGQNSLKIWDLPGADLAFSAAVSDSTRYGRDETRSRYGDPDYAEGHLWLALVKAWSGAPPDGWRLNVTQAMGPPSRLSKRESALGAALLAQSSDLGAACPLWRALARADVKDFTAWYGYAYCLRRDSVVVPDATTPSGWRYRSSYREAIAAYRRAFESNPAILASFRGNSYQGVRNLLMAVNTRVMRSGWAEDPKAGVFRGKLVWSGDSLLLLPYPYRIAQGPVDPWDPKRVEMALDSQRVEFGKIVGAWVDVFKNSAPALEALAVSLEMQGNRASVDTLRRARMLSTDPADYWRIAAAEAWLEVKFGAPHDLDRLRRAKTIADSALRKISPASAPSAASRMSLASLTGRAGLAHALARRAALERGWAPAGIAESAPAAVVLASLGGPVPVIRRLERDLWDQLTDPALSDPERLRAEWLVRLARLSEPAWDLRASRELKEQGDLLVKAGAALSADSSGTAARMLAQIQESRMASTPPADWPFDALYPEARMLEMLHDDRGAIARLDPALDALRFTAPGTFDDPARPGTLVRAMALRAEIAARNGDSDTARQWATAVTILWEDADSFLKPLVKRMRQLAKG